MSQFDWGVLDPYVVDGVQLADDLNQFRDALLSYHRGATRPPYVKPGMLWINDAAGAANWILNVYLSPTVGDKPLFAYNTTTGDVTVAAAAGGTLAAAMLLAQAAANPAVQWNATANPIDAKAWRMTVNAAGALVLSSYNDAGAVLASITFNRDGSVGSTQPVMRLFSEQMLAAAAGTITVAFPAGAKAIEVWFLLANVGNVNDASGVVINEIVGGAPVVTLTHSTQTLSGYTSTAAAGQAFNQNGWALGANQAFAFGVLRPVVSPISNALYITADYALFNAAGSPIKTQSIQWAATPGPVTGLRFVNGCATQWSIGSYARCIAAF